MTPPTRGEPVSLFDGRTLDGWHAVPRVYGTMWPGGPPLAEVHPVFTAGQAALAEAYPARWEVVDGAVEGFQDPDHPGFGGYLVSDAAYADFELSLEMNPDWPADTGVMIRRRADSWHGFQVLVDHRKSGSIGGFYGNGLAGFHGVPYVLDVAHGRDGAPTGLRLEDPATTLEPMTRDKQTVLAQAGDPRAFLEAWRWQGWNALRIRCVGAQPVITTWVNDVLVASIDTATIRHPHYDAAQVADFLGPAGYIAFEVHDNDPFFGEARWPAVPAAAGVTSCSRRSEPSDNASPRSEGTMTDTQDHTPASKLLAEEETLRLSRVDELTCHQIGARIAERGVREGRSVAVAVYLGDWLVYKAMLPGTSLNNDIVIEGKRRVASIEGHSSLWARNRHLDVGTTFEEATGLPLPAWAPFGGAVPLVTTDGTRQGWVIVSGMSQEDDHAFAVDAIRAAQPT